MSPTPTLGQLLTTTVMVCLLSACASDASPASSSASATPPSTRPSPVEPQRPAPTAAPPSALPEDVDPTPSGRDTVLTGTIEAGVEPGCLLLQTRGRLYQVIGAVQGLTAGQEVILRGHPDPNVLTRCQQGSPFIVVSSAQQPSVPPPTANAS